MQHRKNHFFAAKMLDSQLDTLELCVNVCLCFASRLLTNNAVRPSEEEANTQGIIEVSIEKEAEDVIVDACKRVSDIVGFRVVDEDQLQLAEDEKRRIKEKLKDGH